MKNKYKSGYELKVAQSLKKQNMRFNYESLKIPYTKEHTYSLDFITENGILIESKGRFLGSDRKKHLLIKQQHPEYDIRFLFEADQWIDTKTKANKYSDWCTKNGFKYHISKEGIVPASWIKETNEQQQSNTKKDKKNTAKKRNVPATSRKK